ncbi:hypothetical protein GGR56DRAFT_344428 [Xylariaceae sp. FL0804]|nr:hypothetical protein GGR56DRAFT_344428 [Xylariaceae sp. FL0804]
MLHVHFANSSMAAPKSDDASPPFRSSARFRTRRGRSCSCPGIFHRVHAKESHAVECLPRASTASDLIRPEEFLRAGLPAYPAWSWLARILRTIMDSLPSGAAGRPGTVYSGTKVEVVIHPTGPGGSVAHAPPSSRRGEVDKPAIGQLESGQRGKKGPVLRSKKRDAGWPRAGDEPEWRRKGREESAWFSGAQPGQELDR